MGEAVLLFQFAAQGQFDLDRAGGDGEDPRAEQVHEILPGEGGVHARVEIGVAGLESGLAHRGLAFRIAMVLFGNRNAL